MGDERWRDTYDDWKTTEPAAPEPREEDQDFSPYKVWQFFPDQSHECVGEQLDAKEAVELAARMTQTLGARLGTTRRVIITDCEDCTAFEWKHGEGVTFPPLTGGGSAPKGTPRSGGAG